MKYVIHPSVVTDVTQSDKFFDVLDALTSEPAYELFGFHKPKEKSFMDSIKNFDPNTVGPASINVLSASISNLDHALSDWQHKISKEMNQCVSKLFGVNKERAKLYASDAKRYQEEANEIRRMIRQDSTNAEALKAEEREILDRVAKARTMVREMKTSILISEEMYQTICKSTALSKKGMAMLMDIFKKYSVTIEGRYKRTDFRYGVFDDDHYLNEMKEHRRMVSDPDSAFFQELNRLMHDIDTINTTQIFNNTVSIDAATAVHYDLKITKDMNQIYNIYRELCGKIQKRLHALNETCKAIKAGESSDTPAMIAQEIVFLTVFCMKYSNFMTMYLHPQFGLIEAVTNVRYDL